MSSQQHIPIGITTSGNQVSLDVRTATRHGLIAGATGTGKTATLQTLCEGFSRLGVPVCVPDIKGDLSGIGAPGILTAKIEEGLKHLGMSYEPSAVPIVLWDLEGKRGHQLRTTISELGPLLMSKLMGLNDTQEGILTLAFHIADSEELLLLDLEDLDALLDWIEDNLITLRSEYGSISPASLGTIKRKLIELRSRGGERLFGEPALILKDLMRRASDGRGIVNVLDARTVVSDPKSYVAFLLWLLSELFEELPEVGELPLPKLIFFFDEAHLLFEEASPVLLQKIETLVRLIRSKGVGVFFVTQHPLDIPESILSQLGNRVQHALRAFTPRDQKAVRAAAETFRSNPSFDTLEVITTLGVGEALVSLLDEEGRPSVVERTLIIPPKSRLGTLNDEEREEIISQSPIGSTYDVPLDRESAAERLMSRRDPAAQTGTRTPSSTAHGFEVPWGAIGSRIAKDFLTKLGASLTNAAIRGIMGTMRGRR